jgi:hypothetical protein
MPIDDRTVPERATRKEKKSKREPIPFTEHSREPLRKDIEKEDYNARDKHAINSECHISHSILPYPSMHYYEKAPDWGFFFLTNYTVGGVCGSG